MFDLSAYDILALAELSKKIDLEIRSRKESEKQRVRAEIQRLATEAGMTLSEVLNETSKKNGKRTESVAKYANPDDASQTWSGRGRKPLWVVSWIEQGGSLDDLAV